MKIYIYIYFLLNYYRVFDIDKLDSIDALDLLGSCKFYCGLVRLTSFWAFE